MDQDAWGLQPMPTDPPALDGELGWTAGEDADDWGPAQIHVATPVTRALFAYHFAVATYSTLRWIVCRTGIHKRKQP